jgi:hypothetical protein
MQKMGTRSSPSYLIFVQGRRVATLDVPEPEHLECLISVPFKSHFWLEENHEIDRSDRSYEEAFVVLNDFVNALEHSPDPIIDSNSAKTLRSLLESGDSSLYEAYGKYLGSSDMKALVGSFLSTLAEFNKLPLNLLQEEFEELANKLFRQGFIDADVLNLMLNLASEKNPVVLSEYLIYKEDQNLELFLQRLSQIFFKESEQAYFSELQAAKTLHFRLQTIVYLQSQGYFAANIAYKASKLLENQNENIVHAFEDYAKHLNFQKLSDDLVGACGVKDDDSDGSDDESTSSHFSADYLSLKNHPLESIVRDLLDKKYLHPEDMMQIIRLIVNEDDVVLSAFDLFNEERNIDDLVETLQCLVLKNCGHEKSLLTALDLFAKDTGTNFQNLEALKEQVFKGNDVLFASYSLYLEDKDWNEFKETTQKLLEYLSKGSEESVQKPLSDQPKQPISVLKLKKTNSHEDLRDRTNQPSPVKKSLAFKEPDNKVVEPEHVSSKRSERKPEAEEQDSDDSEDEPPLNYGASDAIPEE